MPTKLELFAYGCEGSALTLVAVAFLQILLNNYPFPRESQLYPQIMTEAMTAFAMAILGEFAEDTGRN